MDNENTGLNTQFPAIGRNVWLNHAAISPWPTEVIRAMNDFVADNAAHGTLNYARWMQVEHRLRSQAATLLGVDNGEDIALVANTSTGLNRIAGGLDWQPGDSVVFPATEFPSNRLPWDYLAPRGVQSHPVQLDLDDPERSLLAAIGPSTRLLSVSSVQYDTGLRLDLERLGAACRRQGVLFCIDAIQHLGALPLDVRQVGADFVVAGSHKWLLAPEGLALFWSRPEARERLRVVEPGWRIYDEPFTFDRADAEESTSARRFEPGTLNNGGIHGLDAALKLLLDHQPTATGEALLDRTEWLVERLSAIRGLTLATPLTRQRRAGIVSFRAEQISAQRMVAALSLRDIHAAVRGSLVRLSPHFYTPMAQLETTADAIEDLLLSPES